MLKGGSRPLDPPHPPWLRHWSEMKMYRMMVGFRRVVIIVAMFAEFSKFDSLSRLLESFFLSWNELGLIVRIAIFWVEPMDF